MASADFGLKFMTMVELERRASSKACRNRRQVIRELARRRKKERKSKNS